MPNNLIITLNYLFSHVDLILFKQNVFSLITESEDDADTTPVVVKVTREAQLPDFGQSPIGSQHSEQSDQETPRNAMSAGKAKKINVSVLRHRHVRQNAAALINCFAILNWRITEFSIRT